MEPVETNLSILPLVESFIRIGKLGEGMHEEMWASLVKQKPLISSFRECPWEHYEHMVDLKYQSAFGIFIFLPKTRIEWSAVMLQQENFMQKWTIAWVMTRAHLHNLLSMGPNHQDLARKKKGPEFVSWSQAARAQLKRNWSTSAVLSKRWKALRVQPQTWPNSWASLPTQWPSKQDTILNRFQRNLLMKTRLKTSLHRTLLRNIYNITISTL